MSHVSSQMTAVSPTGSFTARKFNVPTTAVPFPSGPSTTNSDNIIHVASTLRSLAKNIALLTSQAVRDVDAVRSIIAAASRGPTKAPSAVRPHITEVDVVQSQRRIVDLARATALEQSGSTNILDDSLSLLVESSRHAFMPIVRPGEIDVENRVAADIDSISLGTERGKGISDIFYASVVFSIPIDDVDGGRVRSIRLFRADLSDPTFSRPLHEISLHGMETMMSIPAGFHAKNDDTVSMLERRFQADSILNELTRLNPFDRFVRQRITAGILSPTGSVDKSVSDNTKFMDARRLQDPEFMSYELDESYVAGRAWARPGLEPAHKDDIDLDAASFGFTVKKNNEIRFKQIHVIVPAQSSGKVIGDRYYFSFDDRSVAFGHQYQYYVVTVNKNMVQGNRSSIVTLSVDGMRVPSRPNRVIASVIGSTITLTSVVDDQLVEKFEIWKRGKSPASQFEQTLARSESGFELVADVKNASMGGGASWIDRHVIPGHGYIYRVYSVDVFGNKSESPFEIDVTVPDPGGVVNHRLIRPSIIAEVDSLTKKVKITIHSTDRNIVKIRLSRRDLSINQQNFVVPTESARTIMGQYPIKHSNFVHGERIEDHDNLSIWNGYFDNDDKIEFVDRLVSFDRTYQYRVYGVDKFGGHSSYDYSSPVLVYRRPMINSPVNFSSSLVIGASGNVDGVMLSWNPASLDVSTEETFGSQFDLADTSVRTLYQIERQGAIECFVMNPGAQERMGMGCLGQKWLSFNLVEGSSFFDPVVGYSGTVAPGYRPPFLEPNLMYNYRIQAVMSGGYISNKTAQISVFVSNDVVEPQNFVLRTPDPRVNPFFVMLNWDTFQKDSIVDHWEVERAEINNFAASRINIRNLRVFSEIEFQPFRKIYRESSRFQSVSADERRQRSLLISGQHHFLDSQVRMGNSYFYRIRAVDLRNNSSRFIYRGIKLTCAPFERIISKVFTQSDQTILTNNPVALLLSPSITPEPPKRSLSINPTFSTPKTSSKLVPISPTFRRDR